MHDRAADGRHTARRDASTTKTYPSN